MLVYHVFFWIPSVLLPDIPLLVCCSSVHLVSELVMYERYLFGIGAGMEHHTGLFIALEKDWIQSLVKSDVMIQLD
jgi:hypothetical protein